MQTEAEFTAAVREFAMLCGWLFYHTHDSRRSDPGFPDCVMTDGKRVIFAELKVGKGKPTEAQMEWISLLLAAGQQVHIWRPETDWPAIEAALKP